VIIDIQEDEFYWLHTKFGKLRQIYTRKQFTLCKEKFILIEKIGKEDVNEESSLLGCGTV
jgi:hypothetical protein